MTAEVRLVDADELRRRIEANRSAWDAWSYRNALYLLDSLSTVTAPKGWTRDEVLAELAKHPDNVCEGQNIYTGEWVALARELIDQWRPEVSRFDVRVVRSTPDPEWVPLTKLVGRTIHGCDVAVNRVEVCRSRSSWWAIHDLIFAARAFPDGTLNLDTGMVAVRPEAAT